MQLTRNFTLAELTRSATADRLGIDNTPPLEIQIELRNTAQMLQRIRDFLTVPVIVSSGYRCEALNKAIGSRRTSDHLTGQAADIVAPAYGHPHVVAKVLAPRLTQLGIGQLILERVANKAWLHVSTRVPDRPVNRVITISDTGVEIGIQA